MASTKKDQKRAELYMDMIAQISNELIPSVGAEKAYKIALKTVDHIRHVYGGIQLYIPKDEQLDTQLKHHAIFRDYTGRNGEELSKKYGVSIQHLYRVIKQEYGHKQPDLFGGN